VSRNVVFRQKCSYNHRAYFLSIETKNFQDFVSSCEINNEQEIGKEFSELKIIMTMLFIYSEL